MEIIIVVNIYLAYVGGNEEGDSKPMTVAFLQKPIQELDDDQEADPSSNGTWISVHICTCHTSQYNFQNGPCSVKFRVYLGIKMIYIAKLINKTVPKDHTVEGRIINIIKVDKIFGGTL